MRRKSITCEILMSIILCITILVFPFRVYGEGTQPKVTGVHFNYINNVTLSFTHILHYMVKFDQQVYVDMDGGTPYIEIGLDGGKKARAELQTVGLYGNKQYISEELVFVYIPQEGDYDANGIDKGTSIVLNGGKIDNLDHTQSIDTTLYNVEDRKYYVNATKPYIESITLPQSKTYKAGDRLDLSVHFSEILGIQGTSSIPLTLDDGRIVQLTCTYGTDSYYMRWMATYSYTVQEGDMDIDGITLGSSIQGGFLKGQAGFGYFPRELNRDLGPAMFGSDTSGIRIDTQPPSVEACVLPAAQTYRAGRDMDFTVDFDEPVYVSTEGGTPYITIFMDGDIEKRAEYAEGSGTGSLVFRYTVKKGDADIDGISISNSIVLDGGAIADAAGNPAPLDVSFGDSSGIKADGLSLAQFAAVPEPGTYIIGDTLEFFIKFDQPVDVDTSGGMPCIELGLDGGATAKALYVRGTGTDELCFSCTVVSGVGDSNGITLDGQLLLGGGSIEYSDGGLPSLILQALPDTTGIRIEGKPPTVLSVSVPSSGIYDSGKQLSFTVNFDKAVNLNTGDATPYIELIIKDGTVRHAEYINKSGSTGLVFGYTVQDDDSAPDGIGIGTDVKLAGGTLRSTSGNTADLKLNNVGNLSVVKLVGKIPKVVSVSISENKVYKEYDTIALTVAFNEKVNIVTEYDFYKPYIELLLDDGSKVKAEYTGGSGTEYLEFKYRIESYYGINDADGIAIGSNINLDYYNSIKDADGNNADLVLRGLPDTTGILIDTKEPYVTSVDIPAAGAYKAGAVLDFIINFNEKVELAPIKNAPYLMFYLDSYKYITADYVDGLGTGSLRFRYTVKAGDVTNGIMYSNFIGEYDLRDIAGHSPEPGSLYGKLPSMAGLVMDTKRPGIVAASVPSNGSYPAGTEMIFKVSFDEPVFVDESVQPGIDILVDEGQSAYAVYAGGTGTQELQFCYKVKAGESDRDGIILGNTIKNASSISDRAGNIALETLKNVSDTSGILIDGISPSIVSVGVSSAEAVYSEGDTLELTVKFDDAVNVNTDEGVPYLPFYMDDDIAVSANYAGGTGTDTLSFAYVIENGDQTSGTVVVGSGLELNGGILTDMSGNNAVLAITTGRTLAVQIDTEGPTIVSARMDNLCRFLDITFNEGVYGSDDGAAALTAEKLQLEFISNEGNVKDVSISSIRQKKSTAEASSPELTGGEKVIRVFLNMEGIPSGVETIEISLPTGMFLYDREGNPSSEELTTGKLKLSYNRPSSSTSSPPVRDNTPKGFYSSEANMEEGQMINSISVDSGKLSDTLSRLAKGASNIQINSAGEADIIDVRLDGQALVQLEDKGITLEVSADDIIYSIPASYMNVEQIFSQLGKSIPPEDVRTDITISRVTDELEGRIQKTAGENGYQIVVKPMEFSVTCSYGSKKVQVSRFSGYVDRLVLIPDDIDPALITTGVVLNPDGTLSHVPTKIVAIDGRHYAKISCRTNSIYTLISNSAEFSDMKGHWAETEADDMYSRLIVSGVSDKTYLPERNITRAELAAIIVRALGLAQADTDKAVFKDVIRSKWYYEAVGTAFEYGIVRDEGDGKFRPEEYVTRIEAMTMISRAMSATGYDASLTKEESAELISNFIDGKDFIQNYEAGVCIKEEIIQGVKGRILGKENLTRAQAAVIIRRMLKKTGLI